MVGFRTGPFTPRPKVVPTPRSSSFAGQLMLLAGGNGTDPANMFRLGYMSHSWQWPQSTYLDCRFSGGPTFNLQRSNYLAGAVLAAVQLAGAGVKGIATNAYNPGQQEMAILFDSLSPQAWYTDNAGGSPVDWTPATGLPAGNGKDMAPGISFAEALACFVGPATRKADDGFTYTHNGTPASLINGVTWEPLQANVYLAAAAGGIMKTLDGGSNWGYVRPHAVIGTVWPAGAVGRQVVILNAPVPAAAVASLLIVGETKYRILGDNNDWADQNGAPPTTTGSRLIYGGGGAAVVMTADAGGLRYSADKGAHWTTRAFPAPLTGYTDIDMDSGGGLWAIGHDGLADGYIFSSADNGVSWTQQLHFTLNISSGHIRVNPANSLQIAANYLAGGSGDTGFKVSQNGGASWTSHTLADSTFIPTKASGAMQWVGSRIVVTITTNPNTHLRVKYSDDFAATWTQAANIDCGTIGPAVHDFITGGNLGPLFICFDKLSTPVTGCLLRSTNHGSSWDELDAPFGALVSCVSLAYDILTDTLFAIGDDGTVKSRAKASTTSAADWLAGWVSLPATGQNMGNQSQAMVIAY